MYKLRYAKQFEKDLNNCLKRGKKLKKLDKVIVMLQHGETLPKKYRDHKLIDSKYYNNARECHIEPDWLLIYSYQDNELILRVIRTGSHSDLFR